MNEAEWLACGDATRMLAFLEEIASDRKLILFAAQCWVEETAAEDEWYPFVDDITEQVLARKTSLARLICLFGAFDFSVVTPTPFWWANAVTRPSQPPRVEQAHKLRDIFGNPFRPVAFNPACRTETAIALARQMYDARDFGAMPILADALQDAGCDNPAILDHCRDANQPHVRGCWVCDLVLGFS